MTRIHGQVVAASGRHYMVETDEGERLHCFPRGKKSLLACGDRVQVERSGSAQGLVLAAAPRRSLLYRRDEFRQKLIAANCDQVVVVVATEPGFSDELVSRCLVAAASQDMTALIVLNKIDLADRLPGARERLAPFAAAGYRVVELVARESAEDLRPHLAGRLSVLVGQSGMGKSTLINALVPQAAAATREISSALDTGKHTTTLTQLYRLDAQAALIDSPGLQVFGLAGLTRTDIEAAFPEFRAFRGECRFRDCRHRSEPDCAVRAAAAKGGISAQRLAHFHRIVDELES